ncbi:MAG TPA: hypothetical protein DDY78_28985 [Planctomycetales bacterium]|jgi:hypothetical protein|nr:hypothetical protein [Planctomycetales bacterium]
MPFASYTSIGDVAHAYHLECRQEEFVAPIATSISDYFRSELAFNLLEMPTRMGEYSVTETLIFPILREVWKPFRDRLMLWSHQAIAFDSDLCGTPDYIVARRSPLGALFFDLPYLLVVEAKKDDFERGSGQCLAAMLAAQKLNGVPDSTMYGAASNGRVWEFARLQGTVYTLDPRLYLAQELDGLAAALQFVLSQCQDEAARYPHAA